MAHVPSQCCLCARVPQSQVSDVQPGSHILFCCQALGAAFPPLLKSCKTSPGHHHQWLSSSPSPSSARLPDSSLVLPHSTVASCLSRPDLDESEQSYDITLPCPSNARVSRRPHQVRDRAPYFTLPSISRCKCLSFTCHSSPQHLISMLHGTNFESAPVVIHDAGWPLFVHHPVPACDRCHRPHSVPSSSRLEQHQSLLYLFDICFSPKTSHAFSPLFLLPLPYQSKPLALCVYHQRRRIVPPSRCF